MTKLRVWTTSLYMGIVTLGYFFTMLFARLLPRKIRWNIVSFWGKIFQWGVTHIAGLKTQIIGEHNRLRDSAYVVLAKHQSIWETIAFHGLFCPLTYVLKEQLLYIPFFGWGLWLSDMIAIDRNGGMESIKKILRLGKERLDMGLNVIVFPEGTRVSPGERLPYHKGGALLACKAGVPVVPVAHNAGLFWPKNKLIQKSGTVSVSIGPPISTQDKTAAQVTKEAENWIEAEMIRLASLSADDNTLSSIDKE